jgi:ribosomal protein S12 methylthiotransferase
MELYLNMSFPIRLQTKTEHRNRVRIITLGCAKNRIDTEILMRQLEANGFTILTEDSPGGHDVVIINTCGFITEAKTESIDAILRQTSAREGARHTKVYVMGCLSQRYREELEKAIPEVDGYFGVAEHEKIVTALGGDYHKELLGERILTTPRHYAYLKISEGCDRQCSFCAIPLIRGRHVSRPEEDILAEVHRLTSMGVKELILVAQDLTWYGIDRYGKRMLPYLLDKLSAVAGLTWIRLHYLYPAAFPMELLEVIKAHDNICRYIDIPLQHISDRILRSMQRGMDADGIRRLLDTIRKTLPEAALRSTLITGYPGESDEDFNKLKAFVTEYRFDRLGVFTYSHEEKTPAFNLKDDIPQNIKKQRAAEIMTIQEGISLTLNRKKEGRSLKVLIDGRQGDYYIGRTEHDSPEVDNEVLIHTSGIILQTGNFYNVKITHAESYDLYGQPEH